MQTKCRKMLGISRPSNLENNSTRIKVNLSPNLYH